jgi:hypothetical protein
VHFNSVLDSVDAYIITLYNAQKSINISRIRYCKVKISKVVLFINKATSSKTSIYTATKRNRRSEKSNEIGGN